MASRALETTCRQVTSQRLEMGFYSIEDICRIVLVSQRIVAGRSKNGLYDIVECALTCNVSGNNW